ncbi:MAG: protein kinase, partial [Acidobacteria bacterium]|nr:protein kinase [Acidobacteriota bacterium]
CRVFDVQTTVTGHGPPLVFLIMEFLDGESLEARLRREPLPFEEASAIARQLIHGLSAAHAAGIIHRDLKAANVVLIATPGGPRAVITDFGLAREQSPAAGLTQSLFATGAIVGTAAYMAPEQLQGRSVTTAADIHALGVVLFELVTGRHPFEGDTALAVALRRLSGPAPSPREIVKGLDRNWEAATLACLEADPARRPPSAEAVLAILEGAGPRRPLVSRRTLAAAAALIITVTAAGTLWKTRPTRNPEAERHFKVGEEFVRRRSAADLKNAVSEYEQAVRLEPTYADAWAGLATAWAAIANFTLGDSAIALPAARRAAEKAVALEPNSPRAVGILGYIISIDVKRWKQAEPYLLRAVRLDPKRAESRLWYASFLGKSGRSREAIDQILTGLQDDPASLTLNQQLAAEYIRTGEFEKSLDVARELVRLQPFQDLGYLAAARAQEFLGLYDEGLESCRLASRYMTGPALDSYRACILARRGDRAGRAEALRIAVRLEELWKQGKFEAGLLAKVYATCGDYPRALRILEAGVRANEPSLLGNLLNPTFRPMFEDPAFLDLAKSLGLDSAFFKAVK